MTKSYWRSIGAHTLTANDAWNSPTQPIRHTNVITWVAIKQSILLSLSLTFLTGTIIGGSQAAWSQDASVSGTASFAYWSVGRAIDAAFGWTMNALSLADVALAVQDHFLVYVEIPYQISAFAGAYASAGGIALIKQAIVALSSFA